MGGDSDEENNKISPTLVEINDLSDELMQEEIFGPILPILTFDDISTAITHIQSNPKPLAIYVFGGENVTNKRILKETSSGGICFNDVILHPFGLCH